MGDYADSPSEIQQRELSFREVWALAVGHPSRETFKYIWRAPGSDPVHGVYWYLARYVIAAGITWFVLLMIVSPQMMIAPGEMLVYKDFLNASPAVTIIFELILGGLLIYGLILAAIAIRTVYSIGWRKRVATLGLATVTSTAFCVWCVVQVVIPFWGAVIEF